MSRSRAAAVAGLALLASLGLGACSAGPPPDPAATPVAPMATASQAVAEAVQQIEEGLAQEGLRLERSEIDYRPGEPAVIQAAERAVYRVSLPARDEGWVLVYDLGSPERAQAAGESFAAYLGSGVGQTNYPRDAQFALSRVGSALVFSWWSRERAADAPAAEAAFEAISEVGQEFEVRR